MSGRGPKPPIEEEASNVLQWFAADGTVVSVRPSGTEPKIKFYFGVCAELESVADFDRVEVGLDAKIETIKKGIEARLIRADRRSPEPDFTLPHRAAGETVSIPAFVFPSGNLLRRCGSALPV